MKKNKNTSLSKQPKFKVGEVVVAVNVTKSDKLNDPGNLGWMTGMSSEIGKRTTILRVLPASQVPNKFTYLCSNGYCWNEHWLRRADSSLTNFLNDIKSQ